MAKGLLVQARWSAEPLPPSPETLVPRILSRFLRGSRRPALHGGGLPLPPSAPRAHRTAGGGASFLSIAQQGLQHSSVKCDSYSTGGGAVPAGGGGVFSDCVVTDARAFCRTLQLTLKGDTPPGGPHLALFVCPVDVPSVPPVPPVACQVPAQYGGTRLD